MAGHAPEIGIKPLPNAKVAIISSSWHLDICNDLIAGAQRALAAAQVKQVEVQFVPGSFEIPLAAQYAFDAGFDAVVALGLVLKVRHLTLTMSAKVSLKASSMFHSSTQSQSGMEF